MNPLSGTVKLPEIGEVKKVYVAGGVLLVGAAIVYTLRKRKSAAGTSAAQTDPAGNVGTIDAVTGYVTGSAEDLQALGTTTYQPGTDPSSGSGGGGGGSIDQQVTNGPPFADNAAWSQYVTGYLVSTLALDPGAVATDLGMYLAGEPVTAAQRDVINTAIAYGDLPPKAGPNGMPPSINVVGSVTGTGSTPGSVSLSDGTVTAASAVISWTAVTGANSYAWTATGPGYSKSGTVTGTSVTLTGLAAATTYTVHVHAVNSTGAGPIATMTFHTTGSAAPTPPPPAAAYAEVTVVHAAGSPLPWNSTISGIASHYGYGSDWQTVWNDPKNAALRARRVTPEHIQAGDIVAVKKR